MGEIRVAIAGVGNCASSLVQGIEYYRNNGTKQIIGLMHENLGGYLPQDLKFVVAFDIDKRKVLTMFQKCQEKIQRMKSQYSKCKKRKISKL